MASGLYRTGGPIQRRLNQKRCNWPDELRGRWNRGYATEAATAAIDWAFAELDWTEVIHVIAPQNAASQAVARKLGSKNRGAGRLPAPLESVSIDVWGQTREEWQRRPRG